MESSLAVFFFYDSDFEVSSLRTLCLALFSQKFLLSSTKRFILLFHFELIFMKGGRLGRSSYFTCEQPLAPALYQKVFSAQNCFYTFSNIICMSLFLGSLYLFPWSLSLSLCQYHMVLISVTI
jgi:hypothetical protein